MRPEKKAIIEEIRSQLEASSFVILTDYRGMNVGQASELRKRLSRMDAQFHVVKNSLFQRVVDDFDWKNANRVASGPSAIVIGRGDIANVAKLLKAFTLEHKLPVVKLGVCDGRILSSDELDILVKLPSKPVLYGILIGTVSALMVQLTCVLQQKVASLLYVLNAVQEKKRQSSKWSPQAG